MFAYLLGAEDANVSIYSCGLEQSIHQVLLHPESALIHQTVTQLLEFFFIRVVDWWPLGKAVPPSDRHFLYKPLLRIFLFHLNSFYFLPRLANFLTFLNFFLALWLFLWFALRARL
jgi:hypothetical protein